LFRIPVEVSRATAVHNDFMAAAIHDEIRDAAVARIAMPIEPSGVDAGDLAALRQRYALDRDAFVVGCFGLLTPEKRLATVASAVGRVAAAVPTLRLLLVGPVPDRRALDRTLATAGVVDRTVVVGRVPFEELAMHITLPDVAIHLRYPTARETSAALLRLMAQRRPTIMSDLEHLADIPVDAVVRVDPTDEEGEVVRALLRLVERPQARLRLGERAAAFVRSAHSAARALEGYEAALELTRSRPVRAPRGLPAHWMV